VRDGYDTGTLAADLIALMDALGRQRFAVAGHDMGMWIGYALAADHPARRLDRYPSLTFPGSGVSYMQARRNCAEVTSPAGERARIRKNSGEQPCLPAYSRSRTSPAG
jgi:pimeloyl-ACP methyl ester carboxylesterase